MSTSTRPYFDHCLVQVKPTHAARDRRGKREWQCVFCNETRLAHGQFPRACTPPQPAEPTQWA